MARKAEPSKRLYGAGSIFQRKDGRWVARARVDGEMRYLYGRSEQDVRARLSDARAPVPPQEPAVLTVERYLDDWLAGHRAELEPSTARSYELYIKRHITPHLGDAPVATLEPRLLRELYAGLADYLAPASIKQIHRILHKAFGDGVREEALPRNVAALVRPPRQQKYEPAILNPADARRLLDDLAGDWLEPLISLTLQTGMRQGEVLGLRWQDIDLDGRVLHLRVALQAQPAPPRLKGPKTKAGYRDITLTLRAAAALRTQRRWQAAARLAAGSAWVDRETVFTTKHGDYLGGSSVTHGLQRRLKRLGLPVVRFHDLRHSAASNLAAEGVPLPEIARILGHSSIKMTLDLYSHPTASSGTQAIDALERLYGER